MRRPLGTLSTFVLGLLLALTALVAPGAGRRPARRTPPHAPPPGRTTTPTTPTRSALEGEALRDALHTIISDQTKISYSAVWDALKLTDEDPANPSNVIELYSGRSVPKNTNGGDPDDWNREHVWAKSHGDFGDATGPGTDVHHLRPEDVTVNSARGNMDFDEGGSAVSQCPGCSADADSFEPRDAVKGDVARMILYMAVRYEGGDGCAGPRAQRRGRTTARRPRSAGSRCCSSGTTRTRRTRSSCTATT